MKLFFLDKPWEGHARTVLVLGMFDGVHTGHAALIARAREIARQRGAPMSKSLKGGKKEQETYPATILPRHRHRQHAA